MHMRRDRFEVNQYSSSYHLHRLVTCVDCGGQLQKDHHFAVMGYRCYPCYEALLAAPVVQAALAGPSVQGGGSEG